MKLRSGILAAVMVLGIGTAQSEVRAGGSLSFSVFYQSLSPHGYWVDVEPYGRCWYPAYVASAWRPYCEGIWYWTDCGWYWYSEEPWAWATYHYGRWVWHSYYGWVWIPGYEWGPAWVSWRTGGGYIGWAPLPPYCDFGSRGIIFGDDILVGHSWFVFVQANHFHRPCHRRDVIVDHRHIIHKTVNVTRIERMNQVVVNQGPRVHDIERATGQPYRHGRRTVSQIHDDEVRRSPSAARAPAPPAVTEDLTEQGRPRDHDGARQSQRQGGRPERDAEPERARPVVVNPSRPPEPTSVAVEPPRAEPVKPAPEQPDRRGAFFSGPKPQRPEPAPKAQARSQVPPRQIEVIRGTESAPRPNVDRLPAPPAREQVREQRTTDSPPTPPPARGSPQGNSRQVREERAQPPPAQEPSNPPSYGQPPKRQYYDQRQPWVRERKADPEPRQEVTPAPAPRPSQEVQPDPRPEQSSRPEPPRGNPSRNSRNPQQRRR